MMECSKITYQVEQASSIGQMVLDIMANGEQGSRKVWASRSILMVENLKACGKMENGKNGFERRPPFNMFY